MKSIQRIRESARTVYHAVRFAADLPKLAPFARVSPARLLEGWAQRRPGELALAYRSERYTWSDFDRRANQYARVFQRYGIHGGSVVAVLMDNRPDYLFALLGLNKLGATAALINTSLRGTSLEHVVQVSGADHLVAGDEHTEVVRELVRGRQEADPITVLMHAEAGDALSEVGTVINRDLDRMSRAGPRNTPEPRNSDIFAYIYTSGTTGLPKAAIIRNQRMLGANVVFGHLLHQSRRGDVIYVALPLYHGNGLLLGFGAALATGAAVALRRKFSATKFWDDIAEFGATSFVYIGELCRYLLNHKEDTQVPEHRLRVAVGNGLRPDIWEEFQSHFGIPVIREFYGATEGNAPLVNFSGKPGMIGRLTLNQVVVRCDAVTGDLIRNADGFAIRVQSGETGLLLGKVSMITSFDGYVNQRATKEKLTTDVLRPGDCYFNTGDLVRVHDKRWLSFVDRLGDTFRWKGENVSTHEVAEALTGATGVLEANVYGVSVPHAEGRAGMAAIRVSGQFTLKTLATHVLDELAVQQQPLFIRILEEEMQITGTLKQQKGRYQKEGFNPDRLKDPLYFLRNGQYVPVDSKLYRCFEAGTIGL